MFKILPQKSTPKKARVEEVSRAHSLPQSEPHFPSSSYLTEKGR